MLPWIPVTYIYKFLTSSRILSFSIIFEKWASVSYRLKHRWHLSFHYLRVFTQSIGNIVIWKDEGGRKEYLYADFILLYISWIWIIILWKGSVDLSGQIIVLPGKLLKDPSFLNFLPTDLVYFLSYVSIYWMNNRCEIQYKILEQS